MMSPLPKPERTAEAPASLVAIDGKGGRSRLQKSLIAAVTLALLAAAWLFRPAHQTVTVTVSVPTVRVARGAIESTRRVAGSIIAGRFANIAAPMLKAPDQGRGLTLTFLATSGVHVKEG